MNSYNNKDHNNNINKNFNKTNSHIVISLVFSNDAWTFVNFVFERSQESYSFFNKSSKILNLNLNS